MAGIVFNILKKGRGFDQRFFVLFTFSPRVSLGIFLIIPLTLLLLHREMLNLIASSEQMVILYQIFGLPIKVILWTNILMISAVNLINVFLLAFLAFYAGESIHLFDYLKQVLVLNGVLFFAVAIGNGVLYYRLSHSAYHTAYKTIIVVLFVFAILTVFTILFFLLEDRSILAGVVLLLILLVWIISLFNKYD